MNLSKLHPMWKWLGMNEDGRWLLFQSKPTMSSRKILSNGTKEYFGWTDGFPSITINNVFNLPTAFDFKKSLHKRKGDEWIPIHKDFRIALDAGFGIVGVKLK